MGRFRIQLLINITWETNYRVERNTNYSSFSTGSSLLNFDFTENNYGNKVIYDRKNSAHADMCFSNLSITRSVLYGCETNIFQLLAQNEKLM